MPPPRLLLDANLSPEVAQRLTADGFDVISVRDRGRLLGELDPKIMDFAVAEGRAVCTKNVKHFEREHARYLRANEIHFGILVLDDWRKEEVYWALRQFLATHEDLDLLNGCVAVPVASAEFIAAHRPPDPEG